MPVTVIVALLAVASVTMWLRGKSWTHVIKGPAVYAAIGAAAGLIALVLALVVATPLVEGVTDWAVQWSTYPVARGSAAQAILVAIVVGVGALAAELVLRGFIVETVLDLAGDRPGARLLAILVGAVGEALLAEGDVAMRLGAGVFGLGLGWMYIAGGRSVVAPLCARLAFSLGAVALEALQLIG
jgi:hypothetical protein